MLFASPPSPFGRTVRPVGTVPSHCTPKRRGGHRPGPPGRRIRPEDFTLPPARAAGLASHTSIQRPTSFGLVQFVAGPSRTAQTSLSHCALRFAQGRRGVPAPIGRGATPPGRSLELVLESLGRLTAAAGDLLQEP